MHEKTGIERENQRLLYAGKELIEARNGRTMKMDDYDITTGSTILLVIRRGR